MRIVTALREERHHVAVLELVSPDQARWVPSGRVPNCILHAATSDIVHSA
jgi:hypothetical protein